MFRREHLEQIVLDVEFVLLAVVQGVALTTLGVEAIPVLRDPHPVSCVFLASGLLFVLAFWAGALMHALSIVRWPMDLPHYFFYFAVGLLEMITFAQTGYPRAWFGWSCVFYVLGAGLYAYDLVLIRNRRAHFDDCHESRRLYAHILGRQQFEMRAVMPAGFVFCFAAWWALGRNPGLAMGFAVAQFLFTTGFLVTLVLSFSERVRLISDCTDPED